MAWADVAIEITLTVLVILVIGGLSLLVAGWLGRALQVKADRDHAIRIVNRGNFRSLYRLTVKDALPELKFTFLSNEVELATVVETPEEEIEEIIEEAVEAAPVQAQPKTAKKAPAVPKDAGKVLKAGQGVAAKSGLVATVLGTLGSILPGQLGANLKAQAGAARGVQAGTAKAVQAPQAAQRKMDALGQAGGKLGVKAPAKPEAAKGGSAPAAAGAGAYGAVKNVGQPARTTRVVKRQVGEPVSYVQTTPLDPGESLLLTLRIGKTQKRYPQGSFNYLLQSRQVSVDDKLGAADPLTKTGVVHFKPIGVWRYGLPAFGRILVILGGLLGIIYGLTLIWA